MIEVQHLVKDYGTTVAVRDVSFEVGRGQVVGFLGPNGAGKSTTLRILAGYLGATSGSVRVAGHDIVEESLLARRSLGYMPEAAPLYGELRVREYLAFRASLKGVPGKERRAAVSRAMSLANVSDMSETLVEHLSKGYKQRVALADALVAKPPLLILDEPTAGLDPNQIRDVRRLVRDLGESHTILLSTHILPEVESVCSHAIIIARGKLLAQGTLEELRALRGPNTARIVVRGDRALAEGTARGVPGMKRVGAEAQGEFTSLDVEVDADRDSGDVFEALAAALTVAGLGVRELAPAKASLEDVFIALTRAEAA